MAAGVAALLAGSVASASSLQVDSTSPASDLELRPGFELRDPDAKRTLVSPKIVLGMPVTPDLEFEVATGHRRVSRDGTSESGLGDNALEFKWRLARESLGRPAFAVVPEPSLPTGLRRRGLGSGHAGLVVPFHGLRYSTNKVLAPVFSSRKQ